MIYILTHREYDYCSIEAVLRGPVNANIEELRKEFKSQYKGHTTTIRKSLIRDGIDVKDHGSWHLRERCFIYWLVQTKPDWAICNYIEEDLQGRI
jgi:hypothetical protein